jgi:hypothetical protein
MGIPHDQAGPGDSSERVSPVGDAPGGQNAERLPVLILVRDLFFIGKITAVAKSVGASTLTIRDPAQLAGADGRLVLVDLNLVGAIDAAATWSKSLNRPAIGFVSHVDGATILAAREAGIHKVLARSQFVQVLPELLV